MSIPILAQTQNIGLSQDEMENQISSILQILTLPEKISLLSGTNMWDLPSITHVSLGGLRTTDGPAGARGTQWSNGPPSALIPCGVALAATFDLDLINKVGRLLGKETKAKDAHLLLGPNLDISRSPLGGRNFEGFGEDPYLAGEMACAIVKGIQSVEGAGAVVKHFVAYQQERRRFNVDVKIDEKALREIYAKPFETVVKKAHPLGIMTSYNKINGKHVDADEILVNKLLRQGWGFDGLTMSDWGGTNTLIETLKAGVDVEMPGPPIRRGQHVLKSLKSGDLDIDIVDRSVSNILRTAFRLGIVGRQSSDNMATEAEDEEAEQQLLHETAVGGTVLLKNNGILPLNARKLKSLAIIGPNAKTPTAGGSGSAALNPRYISTPFDACTAIAYAENPNVQISFAQGILTNKLCPLIPVTSDQEGQSLGVRMDFFEGLHLQGEVTETRMWPTTNIFMMNDGDIPESLRGKDYSFRLFAKIKPMLSGTYVFGVSSTGRAKLYINGDLLVDNSAWTSLGDTFMNRGSEEARGLIELQAGLTYDIMLEQASRPPETLKLKPQDNTLFGNLSGIRLGWIPPVDEDKLLSDAVSIASKADVAILVVGMNNDWEREGVDRRTLILPRRTEELITRTRAANKNTIVVNQSGCPVSMANWSHQPAAIIQTFYQGMECGNATADVIFGKANPSGKLPITFARKLEDYHESILKIAKIQEGDDDEDINEFNDGIAVGYRWFDKENIEPMWEFGYGLSYTRFDLTHIHAHYPTLKTAVEIQGSITNVGLVKGSETVQAYVGEVRTGHEDKPINHMKALKGFCKISLAPSETKDIKILLGLEAFETFDASQWKAILGQYEIAIGFSSRDIKARILVTVLPDGKLIQG